MKKVIGEIQAIIMETVITRPETSGEELFYELIARGYDGADCVTAIKHLEAIARHVEEDVEEEEIEMDIDEVDVSSMYPRINIRPSNLHNTKGGIH